MIEQLITRVFQTRDLAHRLHWAATGPGSYARHMALGAFYEGLPELIDDLVETSQGEFGMVKLDLNPRRPPTPDADAIVGYLRDETAWVEANMEELSNGSETLENLLANLLSFYYRTIYKLERLR